MTADLPSSLPHPSDVADGRRFAVLTGDQGRGFHLEAGGWLPEVTVAFETWGTLAPDGTNAVLVLHALTGDSHAVGVAGPEARGSWVVGGHDRSGASDRH